MMRSPRLSASLLIAVISFSAILASASSQQGPIPIRTILQHPADDPILILHRGGVITPEAPECSLAAAVLAGQQGYEMLEIDIRESKDHIPVSFHDDTMEEDTDETGRAEDYTAAALAQIKFSGSDETIPTIAQLAEVCREYGMGVMLNIKTDGSDAYYQRLRQLILDNGLENATVCIDPYENAVKHLGDVSLFPLSQEEIQTLLDGGEVETEGKFWFGWPRHIENRDVEALQKKGIVVIPSINIFHYPKAEHMQRAQEDIERMKAAGVKVFQIDSVYAPYFGR